MYNFLKNILFVAIILSSFSVHAECNEPIQPTFKGVIRLQGGINAGIDSITVRYKKLSAPANVDYDRFRVMTDKNGRFSFKIPMDCEPCMLQILVPHKDNFIRLTEHYFVEAQDNIFIDLIKSQNRDSVTFYGKGSEKYNIAHRLDRLEDTFKTKYLEFVKSNEDVYQRLLFLNELTKGFAEEKFDLINKSGMNDRMKKMVNYEHGRIFSRWTAYLYDIAQRFKENKDIRAMVKTNFENYKEIFSYKFDTLVALCPVYLRSLAFQEAMGMFIEGSVDTISLESFYNLLKHKYSGDVKEILITNLFVADKGLISQIKISNIDSLLSDAKKLITRPHLRSVFSERLKMVKGEKVFNATFQNLNGDTISLASLKGKVVLIDLWNIGCSWCTVFHKLFKNDVYPFIKSNKNFVYLSISTDRSKERWIQGINSNLYTSREYLNVSMGKLGINHPFAKYYNVVALPFGLLIDKNGKIFSKHILNTETALDLITSALEELKPTP